MASLILTDRCNLRCPYCFANEFVNKEYHEFDDDAFKKALDFASSSVVFDSNRNVVKDYIRLAGGEPMLHSKFGKYLEACINDERFSGVYIFTNGTLIDKYINLIKSPRVRLLVNFNHPDALGLNNFMRVRNNIKLLLENGKRGYFTLGYNIGSIDFDYGYILDTLKEFKLDILRTSITCPDFKKPLQQTSSEYFKSYKNKLLDFYEDLFKINVVPFMDCNIMPSCYLERKDYFRFRKYYKDEKFRARLWANLFQPEACCHPIIDIYWDLTITRCLLLSPWTREPMSRFRNIADAYGYYLYSFDRYQYMVPSKPECIGCKKFSMQVCTGGCMGYKNEIVQRLKKNLNPKK